MSTPLLKKETVNVCGVGITIHQLSGLDRFDYLDYTSDKQGPEQPEKPSDDAPLNERESYEKALTKYIHQWNRLTFECQSRLVAYGVRRNDEFKGKEIDEVHHVVMSDYSPESIAEMHIILSKMSGLYVPESEGTESDGDAAQGKPDPKN